MHITDTTYFYSDSLKIPNLIKDSSVQTHDLFSLDNGTSLPTNNISLTTDKTDDVVSGHQGTSRPFMLEGDDGIFALLLLCFFLFTRIYRGDFNFFKENIRLLFSSRKSVNLFSETTTTDFWFNFILIFQAILLISIIVFDSILEVDIYFLPKSSFCTIIIFVFSISIFLLFKYLFYRFLGYVFEIKAQIGIWIRNYMLVLEMIGIIAFIPTLVLVYSQSFHQYLMIFFIVLFILSRLTLFYRLILFFFQERINLLFLIPYLCAVEILPYILFYQILIDLYKVDIISLL